MPFKMQEFYSDLSFLQRFALQQNNIINASIVYQKN